MHKEADELLRSDVEAFNAWRIAHPEEVIDLSGQVYDGCALFEAYLFGINFTGCSFRNANLQECVLSGAVLDKSDCSGANISFVQFGPADLIGIAVLNKLANGTGKAAQVLLQGASLRGVVFAQADLSHSSFRETDMEGADFRGAVLEGAKFFHTNYEAAHFDDNAGDHALFLPDNV
jgi:uncharacterized protein YjbI with pentapeptide repeats